MRALLCVTSALHLLLCCAMLMMLCCAVLRPFRVIRFPPSRPMPVSATIADWVGWLDFTSVDGLRKCLKINNRTGEETARPPLCLLVSILLFVGCRGCIACLPALR